MIVARIGLPKPRRAFGFLIAGIALLCDLSAHAQTPNHAVPPGMTCPGDRIVWVNTRSGVYHYQGERYFGSTRQGEFLCEKEARREGDRPTRNGQ
jgi:hypothetical protein